MHVAGGLDGLVLAPRQRCERELSSHRDGNSAGTAMASALCSCARAEFGLFRTAERAPLVHSKYVSGEQLVTLRGSVGPTTNGDKLVVSNSG